MENINSNTNEQIAEGQIIDGRALARNLFNDVSQRIAKLSYKPLLCDVVVGDDAVSLSYVKIKGKRAEECGMEFSLVHLPSTATEPDVISAIQTEQEKENLSGLIVQLPLPEHIDSTKILSAINSKFDVDVINPTNTSTDIVPPTAGAVMYILESLPLDLKTQKFVMLGNGDLVGKPVSKELQKRGLNFQTVLADTEDRAELLKQATVIISGVGKAGILTVDEVSEGVVVIDAGTSESGGSISGDVDFDSVAPKAKYITPCPGGVGPVTVAKLLENVLQATQVNSK